MFDELLKQVRQRKIKGFLPEKDAQLLFNLANEYARFGPCLEIGSYCGLSTVFLGQACKKQDEVLFALDHHRGSEEHQVGEAYHDPELFDDGLQRINSFPAFQATLKLFELEESVVPLVAPSHIVAKRWSTPLAMVFIDGGHSEEAALHDCLVWSKHVAKNGVIAMHDIYLNPNEGGQAPYRALQKFLSQATFRILMQQDSMVVLEHL